MDSAKATLPRVLIICMQIEMHLLKTTLSKSVIIMTLTANIAYTNLSMLPLHPPNQ